MTQEERIKKLESEISSLKEELRKKRKSNVWKNVKDKFKTELNSFDWTDEHITTNCDGEPLDLSTNIVESDRISQAIGTIVRVTLKRKGVVYLEDSDEDKATEITKQILEIMEKGRKNK